MTARAQDKKLWLIGGAVVAVLIVLIGWFGVIHPQLSAAASTRDQAGTASMQNIVLQAENTKLENENRNAAALRADLVTALAELPSDGGLPAFTRQVSAEATASSVELSSVIVGAAVPVAGAAAATATTPDAGTTTGATTGAAVATSAPASPSLVQITISLTATGLGKNDLAFLKAIQVTGPRRALVTASQIAPTGGNTATGIDGLSTLTLTMTVFSAPLSPTAKAALEKLLSGK